MIGRLVAAVFAASRWRASATLVRPTPAVSVRNVLLAVSAVIGNSMPTSAAAFGIAIVRTDLAAVWHPRWVAPRADVASGGNVRSLCVVVVHVSGWLAPTCLCLHVSFSPDHGSSNAGSSRSSPQLRWQLYQQLQPSPSAAVVVSRRRFPLVAQHVRRNPVDHVSVLAVAAASIGCRASAYAVRLRVGGP